MVWHILDRCTLVTTSGVWRYFEFPITFSVRAMVYFTDLGSQNSYTSGFSTKFGVFYLPHGRAKRAKIGKQVVW